jgi:F-type H+-transporting ATPase subunit gamma
MSHVIQLRQRIKTIETLRKVTHAIRLTSRATHAQLQKKSAELAHYRAELGRLIQNLMPLIQQTTPNSPEHRKHLHIVVGSQRGYCGTFNTRIVRFFEEHQPPTEKPLIITVGKKAAELLSPTFRLIYSFDTFSAANFFAVSKELYQHLTGPEAYASVTIYSNYSQTFFLQKATQTTLAVPRISYLPAPTTHDVPYLFDQPVSTLFYTLEHLHFKSLLEEILFKSLVAEHAARFISMDSSTTNADKVLEIMRRDYNKLRQASITREITDLIGGLL